MPTIAYTGVSWDELERSFRSNSLWVEFMPADGKPPLLLNVTRLSNFRSWSCFFVEGRRPDGTTLELLGHCPHRTSQPANFQLTSDATVH